MPIDNISTVSGWFSDTLCKVVTGDGFVRRALYTDSGISVLQFRRCVILTSIDAGAMRGDLGERLLMVDLVQIPDRLRRTEAELDRVYGQIAPELLGALLDVMVAVLRELPVVELNEHARMADFARILAALDRARPDLTGGTALRTYLGQRGRIAEQVVESDCLAEAIQLHMESCSDLGGTAGDLLGILSPEKPPRDWPKNGQAMTGRLKRIRPALLGGGIEVGIPDRRTNKGRVITICRTDK